MEAGTEVDCILERAEAESTFCLPCSEAAGGKDALAFSVGFGNGLSAEPERTTDLKAVCLISVS